MSSDSYALIRKCLTTDRRRGGGGLLLMQPLTVGVSVLMDDGSELPVNFAGAAAVRVAPLAEAGEVTLNMIGLDVGELSFQTDYNDDLSPTVAEPIAMYEFI